MNAEPSWFCSSNILKFRAERSKPFREIYDRNESVKLGLGIEIFKFWWQTKQSILNRHFLTLGLDCERDVGVSWAMHVV